MPNPRPDDSVRETAQPAKSDDNLDDARTGKIENVEESSDAALARNLIEKKQLAPGLVIDAAINKPDMPFEQALPELLAQRKEEMFMKQKGLPKDQYKPLGQLMVEGGLVTAEQVKEALDAQKALREANEKAPLLGDLLVQQLQQHISDVKQAGTKK